MTQRVPYVMSIPDSLPLPGVCAVVGRLLVVVMPGRVRNLLGGAVLTSPTRLDRLLIAGLVASHKARNTLEQLSPLIDAYWRADSATDFHQRVAARYEQIFLPLHAEALVEQIQALQPGLSSGRSTFCEIGCGSGKMLQFFSERLSGVEEFIGIDLSPAQVARNRSLYAGKTLQFVAADGGEWVETRDNPGLILFVYGGVLEYFAPSKLQRLLGRLADKLQPSLLVLVEPIADDHDLSVNTTSYPFGHENTWSHNYPNLCRAVGLTVVSVDDHRIGQQRWLRLVATSACTIGSVPARSDL